MKAKYIVSFWCIVTIACVTHCKNSRDAQGDQAKVQRPDGSARCGDGKSQKLVRRVVKLEKKYAKRKKTRDHWQDQAKVQIESPTTGDLDPRVDAIAASDKKQASQIAVLESCKAVQASQIDVLKAKDVTLASQIDVLEVCKVVQASQIDVLDNDTALLLASVVILQSQVDVLQTFHP